FQAEVGDTSFHKEASIIEQKAYRDTWAGGLDSYIKWFFETATYLQELLSKTGSAYIHLDARVVHYIKAVLDEFFGSDNFLCQIVWKRIASGRKARANKWHSVDDIILVYSNGNHKYTPQYAPYSEKYKSRFTLQDEHGWYFWDNIGAYSQERLKKLEAQGRVRYPENPNALPRIKNYLHEGKGV